MRAGGGKGKGGSYERLICRTLSKWFSGKEHPELFWRSASSGAKATQSKKRGHETKMHGDIMSIAAETAFVTDNLFFELKDYKNWNFDEFLRLNIKGTFKPWLEKLFLEAEEANKIPILIFKRSGSPDFILLTDYFVNHLSLYNVLLNSTLNFIRCSFNGKGITIYLLDYFLEHVDPEQLKLVLEDLKK